MFTKSEIETLDNIVYNDLGRKLQDEGYKVRVDDNGEIIVSHKDTLMPRINFSTYTDANDANDKVSFFAEMKFDATFEVDEEIEIKEWYVSRWLQVTKAVSRFEKQVYTLT